MDKQNRMKKKLCKEYRTHIVILAAINSKRKYKSYKIEAKN